MNASQESSDFVDPVSRPPRRERSAEASTSRVTLSDSTSTRRDAPIEPLSDAVADADLSETRGRAQSNGIAASRNTSADRDLSSGKQTSSKAKAKTFLKSSSPDVPLRIHLVSDINHASTRSLLIAIRSHGGAFEKSFGKADLIVVDPKQEAASKKHLRDANKLGEPIPVVTMDYIEDSAAQGTMLDIQDPKYKFVGGDLPVAVGTARSRNGRNAYTEGDRQAVIDYFIDKPEESWSLNTAAKELAKRIPSHSHPSFQSYLQSNFDKGWNLREKILAARRAAIEGEPSELQARIFRSQYTPSPSPPEQSAPSDGWPRASPQPQAQTEEEVSAPEATSTRPDDERSSPAEDDDEDLQIRRPEPGSIFDNVERSPTKIKQAVEYPSSEQSSPGTSPLPSMPLGQTAPGPQGFRSTPSADEESDPEHFSPSIMSEIQRTETSRLKASQKRKQKRRKARRSSDSSDNSERDELLGDSDEDLLVTGPPAAQAAPKGKAAAEKSEDLEWEGTRRADQKMREKLRQNGTESNGDKRVRFTEEEKQALPEKLAEHIMARGHQLPPSTQELILAKPDDSFWEQIAAEYPSHSQASWRSHYLKNRPVYSEIVKITLADSAAEQEGGDEEVEQEGGGSVQEEGQDRRSKSPPPAEPARAPDVAGPAEEASAQRSSGSDRSFIVDDDMSMPADGIVVMIPRDDPTQRPPRAYAEEEKDEEHAEAEHDEEEWPEAPPPPPIEDEEDDAMQVEAETDAVPTSPVPVEQTEENEEILSPVESEADASSVNGGAAHSDLSGHYADEEPVVNVDNDTGKEDPRVEATPTRHVQTRTPHAVEAGTPVLAQHRDLVFYDFTIDSDEEQRIRKIRARPSLPDLQSRQRDSSAPLQTLPITSQRIASHFATPRRGQGAAASRRIQLPGRRQEDDRVERTREWTRSVSATSSSASPERATAFEPVAVTESSRSRASRIDRGPIPGAAQTVDVTPTRQYDRPQQLPRMLGGRSSTALTSKSPQTVGSRAKQTAVSSDASRSGTEAARQQYRAEVERFRIDFGLNKALLRNLLMPFKASVRDARKYIDEWLGEMEDTFGVDAAVAFEYVKTSQGDFQQAETFLRLASMTRSSKTPDRSGESLLRSPLKRSGKEMDRSFDRMGRAGARGESAKRYRR